MPEHYQKHTTSQNRQTDAHSLEELRKTAKRAMAELTDEQIALAFEIMRTYNIDKAAS